MAGRFGFLLILSGFAVFTFGGKPGIIISELYRDPPGSETSIGGGITNEFVEIMNISRDTVDLSNLWLTDGSECDSVVQWSNPIAGYDSCVYGPFFLRPSQCALILDRDYTAAINADRSSALRMAPGTLLLTVSDNDLGNGLQSDDGLMLYKGTSKHIDTIISLAADTEWKGKTIPNEKLRLSELSDIEGVSIVPVSFLFDIPRYSFCENVTTPGYFEKIKNSWFAEWIENPDCTEQKNSCYKMRCLTTDTSVISNVNWKVSAGGTVVTQDVMSFQGAFFETAFEAPRNCGDIVFTIDNRINYLVGSKSYSSSDSCIKITEIYPKANSGECEWFELVNRSELNSFDLAHWKFGNHEDTVELTDRKILLSPQEYVVICKDTVSFKRKYSVSVKLIEPPRWHTLNNAADTILLISGENIQADMVNYDSKKLKGWNYQSLVRLDRVQKQGSPTLWKVNSIPAPGVSDNSIVQIDKMNISPIPFSPNGDNKNDVLTITIPQIGQSATTVEIYSFGGKKIRTFDQLSESTCIWDGRKSDGKAASTGPFFVVMEMTADGKKMIFRNKGILWR